MRFSIFLLCSLFALQIPPSPAQTEGKRPSLRLTGIDESGKEFPFDTMSISTRRTFTVLYFPKRIVANFDTTVARNRYCTFTANDVAQFRYERCMTMEGMCLVNMLGYRLRQYPASTLVLNATQTERVKLNAEVLRRYLLNVWGIESQRVRVSVLQRNDSFITLQGTAQLFEPVAFADTLPLYVPPIVRFYTAFATEGVPQQWAINIKQRGKNIRSPISAAGIPRPIVQWKLQQDITGQQFFTNDSVRCDFEVRYSNPSIPNERSAPVYFYTKKIRSQGLDTALFAKRCRVEFDDNAGTLTPEGIAALRLFKQQLLLQGTERVQCAMSGENISEPKFQALCKKRLQELAKQLGIPESRLEKRESQIPLVSSADYPMPSSIVELSR